MTKWIIEKLIKVNIDKIPKIRPIKKLIVETCEIKNISMLSTNFKNLLSINITSHCLLLINKTKNMEV